ncbi:MULTISPECIES: helix-turn-helix domain-containing protein [Sporosarcina]|uniref:XRE family transcriptional regulator n=1 Tax=Sporosarcina newyorkensis 2681 TaxID=1027292 RepID=F9DX75_9BACL|nr:helix-turn-helix transcriptional regulator [Sporosarcina newyorkensis]EGQ21123.1 XRE family transcriptional regulator [Sporosarcina newyorkensis 2681]
MKNLGEFIKELRGKESLRDAAKRIGISHTYLDTVEKGFDKRSGKPINPTPETLKMISRAYNCDYGELMKLADYWNEEDITEEKEFQAFANDPELERWYRKLPESDEEDVRKLREMWEIIRRDKR